MHVVSDSESERSGKNMQPENDLLQGFGMTLHSRVLFARSTFFDDFVICGFSSRRSESKQKGRSGAGEISSRTGGHTDRERESERERDGGQGER